MEKAALCHKTRRLGPLVKFFRPFDEIEINIRKMSHIVEKPKKKTSKIL